MRVVCRYLFVLVLPMLLGLAPQSAKADSHGDATAFMEEYLSTFDTGHAGDVMALYNDPFFMIAPSGDVRAFETKKGIRKAIRGWKFYMKKGGVVSSRYGELNVRALSDDTAIASAVVERLDEVGKLLTKIGATYNLRRESGKWKIFIIQLHDVDTILRFK